MQTAAGAEKKPMTDQTRPFNPIEIQLGSTAYYIAPGSRQEIRFAVINRSGSEDYVDIDVRGIPREWVQLDFPVLQVGANDRREASLTIAPPPGVEGAYPGVLLASSQTYFDRVAEAAFDLRVVAQEVTRPAAAPQQPGRLLLALDNANYHVVPGGSVNIQAWITNQGMADETVQITLEGLPGRWVSSQTPVVRLAAGEQRSISLHIQPTATPDSRAGRYPFRLIAASPAAPDQGAAAEGTLTLAAFSGFTSDLTPRHISSGQMARLRIQNLGNIPATFNITWSTPNNDLDFVPSVAGAPLTGPLPVQPGEIGIVDFAVTPRSSNWFGGSSTRPFTVVVQSSEGEAQTQAGEAAVRAGIAFWIIPVVLAFCLTLTLGLFLLWNWNRGRAVQVSATATAQAAAGIFATETAVVSQTTTAAAGGQDTDGDGLLDSNELSLGTNPQIADTDNDRMNDGDEVTRGYNPLNPDTDGDGIIDGLDLEPLDPSNPLLTATAQAGLPPTATVTTPPQETILPPTLTATATLVPTATDLPPQATATFTTMPQATQVPPTQTPAPDGQGPGPIPVAGQNSFLFTSDREGDPEIYRFTTEDNQVVRLTNSPGPDVEAVWSPDGSRILFSSTRTGNSEIFVMNADGSDPVNLTNHPSDDRFPTWSPDGERIAFTTNREGNQDIYLMNADGTGLVNLTNNSANDFKPAWHVNVDLFSRTERVLFTSDRDGNYEIYAVNLDGSELVNLTQNPAGDSLPAVLPEVGQVAFVSDRDGNAEIYVMDQNGGNLVNLTQDEGSDTQPAWAPGGDWVAFTSTRSGNLDVFIIRTNREDLTNITANSAADQYTSWR